MEKEKRFSEELLIAVLLIGLAFGVVAGMAIYASAYPIFQSENWAAWVQAIGSIAAIVGSLWVARSQAKADLQRVVEAQRLSEESKRMAVFALGEAVIDRIQPIKTALEQKDPRASLFGVYHSSVAHGIAGAISTAPIHELRSKEAVLALLDIRDQLLFLDKSIDDYVKPPRSISIKDRSELTAERRKEYDESVETIGIKNMNGHLEKIEEHFQVLCKAVGPDATGAS